jgi:predicted Rossmann-fold nucleotide-binding protein
MNATRDRPIIAVFGGAKSDNVLAAAEELGRAVAREHAILLTGGTEPTRDSVKNAVINGAHPSRWIGIDRKYAPRSRDSVQRVPALLLTLG